MTVLAHLAPAEQPGSPRAGWECPRCLTIYAPDVKACHCAARKPLSERLKQEPPIRIGTETFGHGLNVSPPERVEVIW